MIKEIGKDDLILNVPLLEWGSTGEKFCLISKINVKEDSLGKTFLQCTLRGKDGTPIIGRLFGDTVKNYINDIETYLGKVALVSYLVDEVYGQRSLSIEWMVLPEGDDLKGIKEDLFEAIILNVEQYLQNIQTLYNRYQSVFTEPLSCLFKQKRYTQLYYINNEEVCSGKNGYVYVILSSCWERLEVYYKLGYVNKSQMSIMMLAQLISECVLNQISDLRFDYAYTVYTKISEIAATLNAIGTATERTMLKEVITGYTNARLGVVSAKTESKLGTLLYREYEAVYNNLKYLTSLENYAGTATFQGKFVR